VAEVQEKYRGIALGIDLSEGGGGTKVLHGFCNSLDMKAGAVLLRVLVDW
jgi:hypothetical protein